MTTSEMLLALWLPILLSAIAIFFASALAWMALPHHKKDWIGLPDEDAFFQALRTTNVPPGQYIFPHCPGSAEMRSPEFRERWNAGPHGTLCLWPRRPNMGMNMALSFAFYLITSIFVAYVGAASRDAGASFGEVFQICATVAVLAYSFAIIPGAIWFQSTWRSVITNFLDGVVFGLITGAIFAALWPAAGG